MESLSKVLKASLLFSLALVAGLAVAARQDSGIVAAQAPTGDPWRFPQGVAPPAGSAGQGEVALLVDETGRLHAVWVERRSVPLVITQADRPLLDLATQEASAVLRYATRAYGATAWGAAIIVVRGPVSHPAIALDSDGAVHLLYEGRLLGRSAIRHMLRRPGESAFSAPAYVEPVPAPQWSPIIVADPWGRVHAGWSDLRGGDVDLRHAMRYPDGRWSTSTVPHRLDAGGDQHEIDFAVNVSGDLHALWRDTRAGRSGIYAARLPAGSDIGRGDAWWPDESLARTVGGLQRSPQIAADGSGRLVAAWIDEGQGGSVRVAERAADDALWSLDRIRYQPTRGPLADLDLAAGGGRAYVVWGEGRPQGGRLYGAWTDRGLSPEPLRIDRAPALTDARDAAVALDRLGEQHAAWSTLDEGVRRIVHATLPQPPVSRTVQTVEGWLTYVPRLHNCHGEGYQLVLCDGSPGPEITARHLDLVSLLGGYVSVDVSPMTESACRRSEVLVARVKRAPCPRETASLTGLLRDAYGPVEGAVVAVGPLRTVSGPSGRFFVDRLPPGRYPISATLRCALELDDGIQPLRAGQRLQLPTATFLRADANGDGTVDAGDLAAVGARFRHRPPRDLPCADLDRDGGVDLDDLAIVSDHLDIVGPRPWRP